MVHSPLSFKQNGIIYGGDVNFYDLVCDKDLAGRKLSHLVLCP